MEQYRALFERVSAVDMGASSALFSGLVTVAMLVLVGSVTVAAFQSWSSGFCDEGQASAYVLRSLLLSALLTAVMMYMHHAL